MQIKEQPSSFERQVLREAGELISPAPVFDFKRVLRARQLVEGEKEQELKKFPALKLALILAIYNSDNDLRVLARRFIKLASDEVDASDPANPLPTIGFEVETPTRVPIYKIDTYGVFFDLIGMPRNEVNREERDRYSSWEFSPPPSYTAAVQNRILAELIEGGFIPSLLFSQKPEDIEQHLDRKLVSLHINLGIPRYLKEESLDTLRATEKIRYFVGAFALAFTCAERLWHRQSTEFSRFQSGIPTAKSYGRITRLELKPFEVRTESTYRLIREVQLLGAALFAYLGQRDPALARKWKETEVELRPIFREFNVFGSPSIFDSKPKASRLVAETDISSQLRQVLDRKAREIAQILNQTQ